MNKYRTQSLIMALLVAGCAETQIRYPIGGEPLSNCVRGNPRPLLSRANPDILQTHFKLISPGRSRETAHLRGRVKLTVIQTRCEVTITRLIFDLPGPPRRLDHTESWYKRAALLLEAVSQDSPSPEGLNAMAARLRDCAAPAFGTPIEMGEFAHLSLAVGEDGKASRTLLEIRYTLKI